MPFISSFLSRLPLYLLSLPVLFMAFSVHESAHGFVAWKLGDPTARNLGRITLNPFKHLDPIGTLCMIVAHVGWAKPVPINGRYFKKPKRDWALTGAAGPVSNLLLAILNLLLLRVILLLVPESMLLEASDYLAAFASGEAFRGSLGFTLMSMLIYLMYLGIVMNISLAIFNLIPIPPFDGSRIFYAFLPAKWYFGIMKYERIIMLVFLLLFWTGAFSGPLAAAQQFVTNGLLSVVGLRNSLDGNVLVIMLNYLEDLVSIF